jgi:hypothetical protein
VDFALGDRYFTTFVDPLDFGNRIHVYDTTDLKNFVYLKTVYANWEDSDQGLGAVTT